MHTVCKECYLTLSHGLGQNNWESSHPQAPIPYKISQECHNQSSHHDKVQCSSETALLALNYSILFAVGISKTWGLTQLTCTSNMTWWSGKSRWLSITGTSDIPVHWNFLVMVAAPFLRGSWRPTQDPELFQHVHKVPRKENSCISAVSIIAIHLHHVFPHSIICRKIIM